MAAALVIGDAITAATEDNLMRALIGVVGVVLLATVLADAIATVVVARHARRMARLTRLFYCASWIPYAAIARMIRPGSWRERYLGAYGPLSLLMLLGLWAAAVIVAFAMLQWSAGLNVGGAPSSFATTVYFSASSFFTLGPGQPHNPPSRYLMVLEAGVGFSFLGLVIGYLPVLYQSFSSRELRILRLDARAGSPPSAAQLLVRGGSDPEKLTQRLADWEEWALDLLQTHLSYPTLAYYRSQHPNQSWLAALTVVLDVSALVTVSADGDLRRQAQFTFAAARHALVHTASVFRKRPCHPKIDRLPPDDYTRLSRTLSAASVPVQAGRISETGLSRLREMYEPYAGSLSHHFLMALPPWLPGDGGSDKRRPRPGR
jgi:hypothetical protein